MGWSLAIAIVLASIPPAPDAADADGRVRAAMAEAVRMRMGAGVDVVMDDVRIVVPIDAPAVAAVLEPGARFGGTTRFTLVSATGRRGARTGRATARLRVTADHVHARRTIEPGSALGSDDLLDARHDLTTGLVRALPTRADALRSRSLRRLDAGACIARAALAMQPLVRAGQDLVAIVRIAGVTAKVTVTAAGSGDAGAVVRVVNRQSHRVLKARVVSSDLVEIIHD